MLTLMLLGVAMQGVLLAPFGPPTIEGPMPPPMGAPGVMVVEDEPSGRWVGLRLVPIPPAVEAQVGPDGVMVANVATDSPADKAGIKQWDIVRKLGDKPVASLEQVRAAVSAAGDAALPVEVLRAGQVQKLSLAAAKQPALAAVKWRYREPGPNLLSDRVMMQGMRVAPRPGGGPWQKQDLGPLEGLPDVLQGFGLNPDEAGNVVFGHPPVALDPNAQLEISLRVVRDGTKLHVARAADGKITVERQKGSDPAQAKTYANVEDLGQDDAEAAQELLPLLGAPPMRFMTGGPAGPDMERVRAEFEMRMREMRGMQMPPAALRTAPPPDPRRQPGFMPPDGGPPMGPPGGPGRPGQGGPGGPDGRGGPPGGGPHMGPPGGPPPNGSPGGPPNGPPPGGPPAGWPGGPQASPGSPAGAGQRGPMISESLAFRVQPDGQIQVTVQRGADRAEFSFKSEAEFAKAQPRLFERYKALSQ